MTSKKVLGALSLAAVLGVAGLGVAGANAVNTDSDAIVYTATLEEAVTITAGDDVALALTNGAAAASGTNHVTYTTNLPSADISVRTTDATTELTGGTDPIAYSNTAISGSATSAWNLSVDGTPIELATTDVDVKSAVSPTTSGSFDVTFTAVASADQAQGTYKNNVTYTIAPAA